MANNASKLSALDAEKADRAAASIRPSWAFDDADFEAPAAPLPATSLVGAAKAEVPFEAKLADVKPVVLAKEAPFAGSEIPRDTVIDGMPTVAVGRTIDIGPAQVDVKPSKPERAPPPPRPQATRFGLGADPEPPSGTTAKGTHIMPATSPEAAALAAAAAAAGLSAPPGSSPPPAVEPSAAFSPGDVAEIAPLEAPRAVSSPDALDGVGTPAEVEVADARPLSAPPPAPLVPVAPVAPSISRIEDPIEIPKKKGGPVLWVIGGAVAVAALVGGIVVATSGGDKPSGSDAATATAQAPTKSPGAPAEKPTEKPASAPAPTTPVTPTTATASATTEPSAAPTTSAVATADPTAAPSAKPTATPVAANPQPPKTGTTPPKQPPPKSTGGIRKDTPF